MSLNVSSSGGGDFSLVPAGVYLARCYRLVDLGTQTGSAMFGSKQQKKLMVSWELLDEDAKMDDGRPYSIHKRYTASLSERANLRSDLEIWRGKHFTEEELASFDMTTILGAFCQLQIVHSEDGKYANVAGIMMKRWGKGEEKPEGVNELIAFDIDEPDMEVFGKLSDSLKQTIMASPEWQAQGATVATSEPEQTTIEDSSVTKQQKEMGTLDSEPMNYDNIPF